VAVGEIRGRSRSKGVRTLTREIKFRVWSKQHGMSPACSIFDIQIMDAEGLTDMSQVVLMQYTGLHDKNDKEIYEGDIVRNIKTGKLYTINWHGSYASYVYNDKAFHHKSTSDWGELYLCYMKFEVIGNIYDNPELLEKGAENNG
jgi:uncharacterized phage protein (TIGR01671 family)